MVGNYIRGLNSQEFISSVFVSYYFSDIDVFRYLDVLEKITFRDIISI